MSDAKDYTVGWICAVTPEYVAARLCLDEEHDTPQNLPLRDEGSYSCGKIGQHNVAIAGMPMGEYGLSSAARVAESMRHAFPNIHIAFLVGIGGGVPSPKHDIRLGDIVVGIPGNGESGVLQYDYGKMIQEQDFEPTGFHNAAPSMLRTAVGALRATHKIHGHNIASTTSKILQENRKVRKEFSRPKEDRLYRSDKVHPFDSLDACAQTCGDDESALILRSERDEDEDDPKIHYGLIASANRLMKDAIVRDKFARENDVLCFEMEAAGLVNHFPCLVIRGICDYADSHKSKEWQGYAALTAAAYAKELLYSIRPYQVQSEIKVAQLLLTGCQNSTIFGGMNSGIQVGMNHGTINQN